MKPANAYTNCPICIPARASLATGRYVHRIGYWDNGIPSDGRLRELLDPLEVDARAKADQEARLEAFGGREKAIALGSFDNSPVPGEQPRFHQ